MASNLRTKVGVATEEMRTFHSSPSTNADFERLELPTYPVSNPLSRRNSQAFACSRVDCSSYRIRTSAP